MTHAEIQAARRSSVVGILLSLAAYLLFLGLPWPWKGIAWPIAAAAVGSSCYGLFRVHAIQKRRLAARFYLMLAICLWLPAESVAQQQCVDGQCTTGQCVPTRSRGVGVGLSVGGWRSAPPRQSAAAAQQYPSVVPVWFGSDPTPVAGVYVGMIGGRGVTLTCWHVAKHGVRQVASESVLEVTQDRYGYDMAAVWTAPLSVPAAQFGPAPVPGESVTITGFPGGRVRVLAGRVLGYFLPDGDQRWGDLSTDVACHDGDSGGAVECRGLFVGLLWGTRLDGGSRSAAIAIPAIVDFLRRLRARHEPIEPEPEDWEGLPEQPQTEGPTVETPSGIAAIEAQLAELRKLIEGIERGPQGEPGLPGADGESPTLDYEAIADKVVPLLPNMTFQLLGSDGIVLQEYTAGLGDTVPFQLVPAGE